MLIYTTCNILFQLSVDTRALCKASVGMATDHCLPPSARYCVLLSYCVVSISFTAHELTCTCTHAAVLIIAVDVYVLVLILLKLIYKLCTCILHSVTLTCKKWLALHTVTCTCMMALHVHVLYIHKYTCSRQLHSVKPENQQWLCVCVCVCVCVGGLVGVVIVVLLLLLCCL